ncbi:uncharacterized protein RMCC_4231 [Mycolicibacterium canariasense]|uniref:Uncharacterized protein n=1 Tax=Mycolicibacterium canariasense TaxID=228230 RepID=A0A117IB22_MYCCR|nr:hypothetical protein [Mycolicibacterium canariasense]MCV7211381.1 hypothetical protein [Mycolicibacterium canariasense]ORV03830.1 hypothetical protein AWB94_24035 [Mycolicibacterium canariasense]GAS97265.1 uncharacterized protein RMCC_4231 [Mycolicibacterium canariasense]
MNLTDPQSALAEASTFVDYLVGLAGLGRLVHSLAAETGATATDADDFVHLLLGVAGMAARVEQLAASPAGAATASEGTAYPDSGRWLR